MNDSGRLSKPLRHLETRSLNRRRFLKATVPAGLAARAILPGVGALAGAGQFIRANGAAASSAARLQSEDLEATGMLTAPEPDPKRGGTARLAIRVNTPSFDIQQGGSPHVLVHMYNRLIRLNPLNGFETIIPDLATSWEAADDGLSYTFNLREGVTFHDGSPFTAEDVVATFARILSPPEGIIIPTGDTFRGVDAIEQIDDMTVQFFLSEPRPEFLLLLTNPVNIIFSKAALDENDQDLGSVIAPGTGPFIHQEHTDGVRWAFEPNPNYWNPELPYVDMLEIINAETWSDRGTAVLTDRADWSWNVSRETFDEGLTPGRADEIGTNEVPSTGLYTIVLNTEREPLNDPRVRHAMHLAISRPIMINAFSSQETINLSRWVPHSSEFAMPQDELAKLPAYAEDKTEALEEAKALMAEAGFPDGISGLKLLSASVAPHAEILAPAIQDQLKRGLNIDTEIQVMERALMIEEEQAGNFDLVLDTFGVSAPDFSLLGHQYFKTDAAQNYGKYASPEFDELLMQSDNELDPEARQALIREIEDMLDQDAPWIPIGWTFHLLMWRQKLKGLAFEERTLSVWGQADTAWIDE